LVQKGFLRKEWLSWAEASDHVDENVGIFPVADSRINRRVTFRHADWFIHIMALDKNFERFALELQTEDSFENGLRSDHQRPGYHRFEVVSNLSELKPVLDDFYKIFERQEEERRQQARINAAVAAEREKWERKLAEQKKEHQFTFYDRILCNFGWCWRVLQIFP